MLFPRLNDWYCTYGHKNCPLHLPANTYIDPYSMGIIEKLNITKIKGIAVVTGCFGFIPGHFTKFLLNEGWIVYGIDKMSSVTSSDHYNDIISNKEYMKNFIFIKEDICNLQSLPDCDVVFNFAASSHVDVSLTDPNQFIHDNVLGVQNLLNLINKKDNHISSKPLLYHISTDEVVSEIENATEESPLNASSAYSASKASAELLIKAHARTHGLNYIIVRPTNTVGTHQYPEKFIPISLKLMSWGKQIRLHNKGEPRRNWLCVEDLCDAVYYIYNYHKPDKNVQELYNIAGNVEQTNLVTATKLLKCLGISEKDIEKHFDLSYIRPGQDMFYSISDTKLKSIGWAHKYNFNDMLPNIIKWYTDPEHNRLFL